MDKEYICNDCNVIDDLKKAREMADAEFEEYIKAEVFNDNSDEKNCKSDVCNFECETIEC